MNENLGFLSNEQTLIILPTIILIFIIVLLFKTTFEYYKYIIKIHRKREFNKIELERKRIANDLHDYVANKLISIRIKLEDSLNTLQEPLIMKSVEKIISDIGLFHEDLRFIVEYIYPKELMINDLSGSFFRLGEELSSSNTNVLVDFNLNTELNSNQSHQLFRIAQEKLTNIIKYQNPNLISVSLYSDEIQKEIVLIISYKIEGLVNSRKAKRLLVAGGRGLFIIKERMKLIGAKSKWAYLDGVFQDITYFTIEL